MKKLKKFHFIFQFLFVCKLSQLSYALIYHFSFFSKNYYICGVTELVFEYIIFSFSSAISSESKSSSAILSSAVCASGPTNLKLSLPGRTERSGIGRCLTGLWCANWRGRSLATSTGWTSVHAATISLPAAMIKSLRYEPIPKREPQV